MTPSWKAIKTEEYCVCSMISLSRVGFNSPLSSTSHCSREVRVREPRRDPVDIWQIQPPRVQWRTGGCHTYHLNLSRSRKRPECAHRGLHRDCMHQANPTGGVRRDSISGRCMPVKEQPRLHLPHLGLHQAGTGLNSQCHTQHEQVQRAAISNQVPA